MLKLLRFRGLARGATAFMQASKLASTVHAGARTKTKWLAALAAGLFAISTANAQVSYTQNFNVDAGSWTGSPSRFTGATACGGTGGALRYNLYSSATTANFVSPNLGTSFGGVTTLSFDYKVANWSGNTVGTPATFGTVNVQYSSSASGPWVTAGVINSTNHIVSGSCATVTYSFSPPAGALFVRLNINWGAGDYYFNLDNVTVSEAPTGVCSGTPAPGNTVSSVANTCSGSNFTLSVQNNTIGSGVTYQWQSATNAAFTSGVTNLGTASTQITSQTAPTYYRLEVTCAGNTGTSTPVLVGMNTFYQCYCIPTTTNGCASGDHVTNVTFSNINNTTGACISGGSYSNYQNLTANVIQGTPYNISVSVANGGTEYAAAWIDYNADGAFDASEFVALTDADATSPWIYTGTAMVPANATVGTTGMRVRSGYSTPITSAQACSNFSYGETEDYLVSIAAAPQCSAAGLSGGTAGGVSSACSGSSFTIADVGYSSGELGLSYIWQRSTTGPSGTYADITGATNPASLTTSQTVATSYRLKVTCSNGGGTTVFGVPVNVAMNNFYACYCASAATNTADTEIKNVTFGDLDNTSTCAQTGTTGSILNRYSNFTNLTPPDVDRGNTYSFSVNAGVCASSYYDRAVAIYIDLNRDGDFADTGELVYASANLPNVPAADAVVGGNYSIPTNASVGITGMRVILAEGYGTGTTNGVIGPCISYGYGETEDYLINIQPGQVCTGTPSGITISGPTTSCGPVTYTASNIPTAALGLTYQWEVSTTGPGGTFSPIASATTSVLNTTQTATSSYRLHTTCTNSGLDDYSNVGTVTQSPTADCYCTSSATNTADEDITKVVLNTLTNNSACNATGGTNSVASLYNNYTALPAPTIERTVEESIAVTVTGCGGGSWTTRFTVYIDWNSDGDFADAGEAAYTSPSFPASGSVTTNGTFTVPATAVLGITRMRIVAIEGTPTPCGTYTYGETEDYQVNIAPAPACPRPSGITANSVTNSSATINFTTVAGATSGYDYRFRETGSSDPYVTGTLAAGATSVALSNLYSQTSYTFDIQSDCGGSGQSGYRTIAFTTLQSPLMYTITQNTGVAFSSIMTTGTSVPFAAFASTDDALSATVNLPGGMTFEYQGNAVTGFKVSTNGWMTFDLATTITSFQNALGGAAGTFPRATLAPFWEDLVVQGNSAATNTPNNKIKYQVTGTTGNHVLTIEWANMETYLNEGSDMNFQVKLYEADNHIEYVYGNMQGYDGTKDYGYSYSLGMNGFTVNAAPIAGQVIAQQAPGENCFGFANATTFNTGANALNFLPNCNSSWTFTPSITSPNCNTPATVTAPANDNCAGAISLNAGTGFLAPSAPTDLCNKYSSKGATASAGATVCASGNADDDVWFKFDVSATSDATVSVTGSGGYNPVIQVYSGSCGTLTEVGTCTNTTAAGAVEKADLSALTPGTYYVRVYHSGTGFTGTPVDGNGTGSGRFSISAYATPSPPANDDCAGAEPLATAAFCNYVNRSSANATASAGITACLGTADDDVWFSFVASQPTATITVQGVGTYNPVVQVFSGACGTLTSMNCNNATGNGGTETVSATGLANGITYYVRVYHSGTGATATGSFNICVVQVVPTPPDVYCHPTFSGGTSAGDYISYVEVNSLTNTTGASGTPYYTFYNMQTDLSRGELYTATVSPGSWSGTGNNIAAFIDFNQDNDFSDPGEKLGQVNNLAAMPATGSFNFVVPVGATLGVTRMRFIEVYSNADITNACATFADGEVEDYLVNITSALAPLSGTYTINPAGTGNRNFVSISQAANALAARGISANVIINIAANSGPYNEKITFLPYTSSSSTARVTINGNGNVLEGFIPRSNTAGLGVVTIDGADNITINGFAIQHTPSSQFGWGIHLINDAQNIVLQNNQITVNGTSTNKRDYMGIVATASYGQYNFPGNNVTNLSILNNQITGGYEGIRINGNPSSYSAGIIITGNTVTNAYKTGLYLQYLNAPVVGSATGTVAVPGNNVVTMRTGNPISQGIHLSLISGAVRVQRNKVSNAGLHGLYLLRINNNASGTAVIANNMIGGGFQNSVEAYGILLNDVDNAQVVFNSVNVDNANLGIALDVLKPYSNNLDIRNNSLAYTGGGAGYAMRIVTDSVLSQLNYNNYYSNGSNFVLYDRRNRPTLDSLRNTFGPTALVHDVNSKSGDPGYVSATNLHSAGTQLSNSGQAIAGITTEYDAVTVRTGNPDIGADERATGTRLMAASAAAGTLELSAYPNPVPTGASLSVRLTSAVSGVVAYQLTDLLGRVVLNTTSSVTEGTTVQTLEVSRLSKGLYILTVEQGAEKHQIKIVKE